MAYASRFGRGYLSGFNTIQATGAITSSSTVTGTDFLATARGTGAAPAFRVFVTGDTNAVGILSTSDSVLGIAGAGATRMTVASVLAVTPAITFTGTATMSNGFIMPQVATPSAPAAGSVHIYNVDNGASKSQARALFDSGAAQALATEP